MIGKIETAEFLSLAEVMPVIDVRSPGEFLQGHIPGAISFPLFSDEERASVGIIYKNSGREAAVLRGFEIAGPKLAGFIKRMMQTVAGKDILLHCWRGGLRSEQMAWLMDQAGFRVKILEGGYKAYRRFIRNAFEIESKIIVLGGMTGSGKTDMLHSLAACGEQVLDLEKLACHKGSVFGGMGQVKQPTNEQFENDIAEQWLIFDYSGRIWIEDESRSIGNVIVPDPLFDRMSSAPLVFVVIPEEDRVNRIVREYACFGETMLGEAILKISEKMGGGRTKTAIQALKESDFQQAVKLSLEYYDKSYRHSVSRRTGKKVVTLSLDEDDPEKSATQLRQCANSLLSGQ